MTNIDSLFNTVSKTIKSIDSELKDTNETGIFFAPELYTAFRIGQDITKNRKNIFGDSKVVWLRETALGNGGISDIIFDVDDRKLVIELKIKSTGYAYESDMLKLLRLPDSYEKYFLVLMDSFEDKADGRPEYILSKMGKSILEHREAAIPTSYSPYSKSVNCHIHLYKL